MVGEELNVQDLMGKRRGNSSLGLGREGCGEDVSGAGWKGENVSGTGWKGQNVLVGLLIFVFLLVFPWPGITAIIIFFSI